MAVDCTPQSASAGTAIPGCAATNLNSVLTKTRHPQTRHSPLATASHNSFRPLHVALLVAQLHNPFQEAHRVRQHGMKVERRRILPDRMDVVHTRIPDTAVGM